MKRLRLKTWEASNQADVERWQCETCSSPAQEDGPHCVSCATYWDDVRNGIFDDCAGRAALEASR